MLNQKKITRDAEVVRTKYELYIKLDLQYNYGH